jgi:RNA polymerase sigma-70 factor (ECF subfamily)
LCNAVLGIQLRDPSDSSSPADASEREPLNVAALTRAMAKGDEMAWRTFYDAYFDRLWRYLLVVAAGNEDAAREALQGAMVRVARHIKVFRDESAFWSWLTVLARSALADETRKRRRYFSFLDRFTRHSILESEIRDDHHADESLRVLLAQHVALLPPEEQRLVERKYSARRSVREIADELQTTEKAVESKLSRVRRKLKDAVLAGLKHESRS